MTEDEHKRVQELRQLAQLRQWIIEAESFICLIRHRSDEYEAWLDKIAGYRREIKSIESRYK